jgi:hypothetical protein
MRRKRPPSLRTLFNLAAAVSLVLGLVIALLWARSYWWLDKIGHARPRPDGEEFMYVLISERGEVQFQDLHWQPPAATASNPFAANDRTAPLDRPAGFFADAVSLNDLYAQVPAWLLPPFRFGAFHARQVREMVGTTYGTRTPRVGLRRRVTCGLVVVPHWMLLAPTVVLPLVAGARALRRRWRARNRQRAGHCPVCGYDLRATPDRCPECGAAPQPPHNPPMQRTATA